MKIERKVLNQTLLKDARKAFDILDTDRVGTIDMRDLRVSLRALGWESAKDEGRRIIHEIEVRSRNSSVQPRIVEGNIPICMCEQQSLGRISFETFCEILEYKLNESGHIELILSSFDAFKGENGLIGFSDLKRIAGLIGETARDDELQQMIDEADEDGDGYVSRDEFIKLLSD